MGLLTTGQIASIKDALEQVTDTFFNSPVLYRKAVRSFDRWGESGTLAYEDYSLFASVEYRNSIEANANPKALLIDYDLKFSFNERNLQEQGLTEADGTVNLQVGDDRLVYRDKIYQAVTIIQEGFFDSTAVIFNIWAKEVEDV